MITRPLSSVTAGLVATTGLLYLMQLLIASGEVVVTESRQRHFLDWISPKDLPDTPVETKLPTRPDVPQLPPITELVESTTSTGIGVGFTTTSPAPRPKGPDISAFGSRDGPLINIIKVQPIYPVTAANRNLEGTVIVEFDVTALGKVENVVVVDSTSNIFNKAAIEAAYRFKYKPRVVDGTAYGATGLQQLFRFEMEK